MSNPFLRRVVVLVALVCDPRRMPAMRRLALAAMAILVLAGVVTCRRSAPEGVPVGPVSSWKIPQQWSLGRGQRNGKAIFTRFNVALKPFIGRPEFPDQVGIAVPLKNPAPGGVQTGSEAQELNQIEDEIKRRFLPANESLFAGVITTDGMREFVLYTRNPRAVVAKATELSREIRHHQIQFVINGDPEWENFKTFAAGI